MSEQRIMHGATIHTATPEEVAQIVATAFDRKKPNEYRRFKGVVNLNAAGAGQNQTPDDPIVAPTQYDLILERITFGGTGAANALVALYENQVSDIDLLEVVQLGAAGKYSDAFSNNIYVTSNSAILVVVTGGVANLQVTYNIQARFVKH